jgi:hypothetical protein
MNDFSVMVSNRNMSDIGILSWDIYDSHGILLSNFSNNPEGTGNSHLPGSMFPMDDSQLKIQLNLSNIGISFPKNIKIPSFTIPIRTFTGRYRLDLEITDSFLKTDFRDNIQGLIHNILSFNCVEDPSVYPLLRVNIIQRDGDSNEYITTVYTNLVFKCEFLDKSTRLFQSQPVRGFGTSKENASRESFGNALSQLLKDNDFVEYVKSNLKS